MHMDRNQMDTFTVVALSLVMLLVLPTSAGAAGFDIFAGSALHTNLPITIGRHAIENPQWETRPLEDSPYYVVRFGWGERHEIELLHDKVYMGYDTADIQRFNMSDGFNMLLYNFVGINGPWETRYGLGAMIVHPEGTVDGVLIARHGDEKFRLGGIGVQAALGYRHQLGGGFSLMAEGKLTAGYVHIGLENIGSVKAFVVGQHAIAGVGYQW